VCNRLVADFGMSRIVTTQYHQHSGFCIRASALEVLKSGTVYKESDIWSFGVAMWEAFHYCRKVPYSPLNSMEEIKTFLENNKRLTQPEICPSGYEQLKATNI
jgi:hypothetical protein